MSPEFDFWEEDAQPVLEAIEPEEKRLRVFAVKLSDEMLSEPEYICSHPTNAGNNCRALFDHCDYKHQ